MCFDLFIWTKLLYDNQSSRGRWAGGFNGSGVQMDHEKNSPCLVLMIVHS